MKTWTFLVMPKQYSAYGSPERLWVSHKREVPYWKGNRADLKVYLFFVLLCSIPTLMFLFNEKLQEEPGWLGGVFSGPVCFMILSLIIFKSRLNVRRAEVLKKMRKNYVKRFGHYDHYWAPNYVHKVIKEKARQEAMRTMFIWRKP